MGQSLEKLAAGSNTDEKRAKRIGPIIENYYDKYFSSDLKKQWKEDDFYQAVCEIVEEVNRKLGNTQFRVPRTEELDKAYKAHHKSEGEGLKREEFQQILQDVIQESRITGIGGAKDVLLYVFGVPAAALFVKQRAVPRSIPNEVFIPAVTSATVYVLAKLNKI